MNFQQAVERFKELHPEYSRPDGARDQCQKASAQFIDFLIEHGFLNKLRPYDEWGVDEVKIVRGVIHYAARIGFMFVDWTARQFNPRANWPQIYPAHRNWVSRSDTPYWPGQLTGGQNETTLGVHRRRAKATGKLQRLR